MIAAPNAGWLIITPEGFFSGSDRDTDMLTIVRGLESTNIGQVHRSLYNPDLVREALAGDPDGEVKRAAQVIDLSKVLAAAHRQPLPSSPISPAAIPARTSSPSRRASRMAARASAASNGASMA